MSKMVSGTALEVLTLSLDGNLFAIEAKHVREILDLVPITEVPTSNPFVGGLINVRGKVVPLADLRHKFGMTRADADVDTRIVVIEIDLDGDPTTIGLLADKVHEVTEMAAATLEETPPVGMIWRPEFVHCIAKRGDTFVVVLDIAAVFASTTRTRPELVSDAIAGRKAVRQPDSTRKD